MLDIGLHSFSARYAHPYDVPTSLIFHYVHRNHHNAIVNNCDFQLLNMRPTRGFLEKRLQNFLLNFCKISGAVSNDLKRWFSKNSQCTSQSNLNKIFFSKYYGEVVKGTLKTIYQEVLQIWLIQRLLLGKMKKKLVKFREFLEYSRKFGNDITCIGWQRDSRQYSGNAGNSLLESIYKFTNTWTSLG